MHGTVAWLRTVTFIPPMARLVRARTLEIKVEDYVLAARALGASDGRIMLRHVLPNAMTVIMVEASLAAGQAVLLASALGFIGRRAAAGAGMGNHAW